MIAARGRRAARSGPLDKLARAWLFGAASAVHSSWSASPIWSGSYLIKPDAAAGLGAPGAYLIDPVRRTAPRRLEAAAARGLPAGRPGRPAAAAEPARRRARATPTTQRQALDKLVVAATLRSDASCPMPMPAMPFDDDKLNEECGVFGIFGHAEAAAHAALGLHALQHRGQEAAGIVTFDGEQFHSHRGVGLVGDTFSRRSVIEGLPGHAAIGHARYSTTGASMLRNVQPLFADFAFGGLAVAHNGNLTNAMLLRRRLVEARLAVPVDHRHRGHRPPDRPQPAPETSSTAWSTRCAQVEGAYSLVGLFDDVHHRRARSAGRAPAGAGPARRRLDPRLRDLRPRHPRRRVRARRRARRDRGHRPRRRAQPAARSRPSRSRFCIFEYVYFARPDSVVEGTGVYEVRKRIGAELARESGVPADVVVPVPDSGVPAAIGYAAGIRHRRSSSASSATTMSAAPSSSRPTTSAIWA